MYFLPEGFRGGAALLLPERRGEHPFPPPPAALGSSSFSGRQGLGGGGGPVLSWNLVSPHTCDASIPSELVPGPGRTEEAVLEVADPELPVVRQAAAHVVHGEQHGHADLRAGQIQPQGATVLREPRSGLQQPLLRLKAPRWCNAAAPRCRSDRGELLPPRVWTAEVCLGNVHVCSARLSTQTCLTVFVKLINICSVADLSTLKLGSR